MIGNSTEISITEDQGSVRVIAIKAASRTAIGVSIACLVVAIVLAYFEAWTWVAISAGAVVLFAVAGFSSSTTVLVATKDSLRSTRESTFAEKANQHLRWSTLYRLDFDYGGENEPNGLYAFTGRFSRVCLIQDITLEQSTKITNAIFRKFPMVVMADPPTPLTTLVSDTFKELTKGWRAKDDSASR